MSFNFEKFTDPDSPYDAKVSIRRTGQFGFNSGAVNKYRLKEYASVVLYYDAKRSAVGIEPRKDNECEGALDLNLNPANCFVRAKNFCDRFGIEYDRARRFSLKKDDESRFLYFEIGEEGITADENTSDEADTSSEAS